MAKNYKETTTQAAVLRTSTKTLSFWCNIREAPLERFAELIEGNIRIALQDFSGGKGDKSKFAYFNLEISDIYEIKDCMQAKKSFFAQKIYGKHPETGGQFNGMCKSFHFALQYTEKAQNGELSRNPYYLCIKNGFAQAAPGQIAGSFYERKGTFQEGVAVFIRLSERDLKNLLRKVTDYIRVFQMLAGQHLIPLGLAQITYKTTVTSVYDTNGTLISTQKDGPYEVSREKLNVSEDPSAASAADTIDAEVARVSGKVSYDTTKAAELLAKLNADRASAGLGQLQMNTNSLTYKLAVLKAADMAIYDYSSDDSPLYGTLSELAQKYGGNGDDVSENIWKVSVKSADEIDAKFQSNEGSRGLRMSTGYTQVGIAIVEKNNQDYIAEVYLE